MYEISCSLCLLLLRSLSLLLLFTFLVDSPISYFDMILILMRTWPNFYVLGSDNLVMLKPMSILKHCFLTSASYHVKATNQRRWILTCLFYVKNNRISAHAAAQGSLMTHSEESATRPLLHTWSCVTVIESTANFVLLNSQTRYHCDSYSWSPGNKVNFFPVAPLEIDFHYLWVTSAW